MVDGLAKVHANVVKVALRTLEFFFFCRAERLLCRARSCEARFMQVK